MMNGRFDKAGCLDFSTATLVGMISVKKFYILHVVDKSIKLNHFGFD